MASFFKGLLSNCKVLKYILNKYIKHMPTVEQIGKELHFMYSLCLLLSFNIK